MKHNTMDYYNIVVILIVRDAGDISAISPNIRTKYLIIDHSVDV